MVTFSLAARNSTVHLGDSVPKGSLVGFQTFGTPGLAATTSGLPNGKAAPVGLSNASRVPFAGNGVKVGILLHRPETKSGTLLSFRTRNLDRDGAPPIGVSQLL